LRARLGTLQVSHI